jgi:hypothetical protein
MSYEQKPGGGSLFKNTKKKEDKHPEYTGEIVTPEGKKYRLAAWIKEGKNGKFFSLKMSVPQEKDLPF